MAKYHLRIKRFKGDVKVATAEFFEAHPWQGTPDEQLSKFQKWVNDAAAAYSVVPPEVTIVTDERILLAAMGEWEMPANPLPMGKFSVLTLFHTFRLYLQAQGVVEIIGASGDEDAASWACSLFYKYRPTLFRRAVRNGQVAVHVTPEDLLSSETMARVRELRLAGQMQEAEDLLMGRGAQPLSTEEEEAFEALVEGFAEEPVAPSEAVSGPWNTAELALLAQADNGTLTVQEVAAQTGRTVPAVRSALRRMRMNSAD